VPTGCLPNSVAPAREGLGLEIRDEKSRGSPGRRLRHLGGAAHRLGVPAAATGGDDRLVVEAGRTGPPSTRSLTGLDLVVVLRRRAFTPLEVQDARRVERLRRGNSRRGGAGTSPRPSPDTSHFRPERARTSVVAALSAEAVVICRVMRDEIRFRITAGRAARARMSAKDETFELMLRKGDQQGKRDDERERRERMRETLAGRARPFGRLIMNGLVAYSSGKGTGG